MLSFIVIVLLIAAIVILVQQNKMLQEENDKFKKRLSKSEARCKSIGESYINLHEAIMDFFTATECQLPRSEYGARFERLIEMRDQLYADIGSLSYILDIREDLSEKMAQYLDKFSAEQSRKKVFAKARK